MRVLWQTQSRMLRDAFAQRNASRLAVGGLAYEYSAAMDLSRYLPVNFDDRCVREIGEGHIPYACKVLAHPNRDSGTLYVIDPFVLASGKLTLRGKTVSIVHHIDTELMQSEPTWRIFFAIQLCRLRAVDRVVAVSRYWKDYLENRGCRNVTVIYNSFDLAEFQFKPGDRTLFRREHGIATDRPMIYLGSAKRGKGVPETYAVLRERPYTMVTSGPADPDVRLPVLHLDLCRRDYLRMLAAADVVTAMSTMPEGWNRTVHEALLCRTPVVGSGSGGMLELLTEGGQLLAEDFFVLPERIEQALSEADRRAEAGYAYAARFDSEYRTAAWQGLMRSLSDNWCECDSGTPEAPSARA